MVEAAHQETPDSFACGGLCVAHATDARTSLAATLAQPWGLFESETADLGDGCMTAPVLPQLSVAGVGVVQLPLTSAQASQLSQPGVLAAAPTVANAGAWGGMVGWLVEQAGLTLGATHPLTPRLTRVLINPQGQCFTPGTPPKASGVPHPGRMSGRTVRVGGSGCRVPGPRFAQCACHVSMRAGRCAARLRGMGAAWLACTIPQHGGAGGPVVPCMS